MISFILARQFKASVWSYYRSQGLTEDDNEDEEDPSLLYDLDPHSNSNSLPEDALTSATISPANDIPPAGSSGRTHGTRDSLAAVRARAQMRGGGSGRGAGGRPVPADETYDEDGDTTANITAMPLPGARRR